MGDEAALRESPRLTRQRIDQLSETTAQSGWHRRPVRTPKPGIPERRSIPIVAEEQLVGPFTSKHDLHVISSQTCDEVQGDARGERDRFVLMPDEMWQCGKILGGADQYFAVLRADRPGNQARIRQLVRFAL